MNKLRFTTIEAAEVDGLDADLAISCLGFESRATNVALRFFGKAKRKVALAFDRQQVLAFSKNHEWFHRNGVEIFGDITDAAFQLTLEGILGSDLERIAREPAVIAVDVSCFDRYRLAVLCQLLMDRVQRREAVVFFCYNIAAYSPPREGFSVNAKLQPVHPAFVGARADPLCGTTAIIGLGYEKEKALGAAEYLEASEVFAYSPESRIPAYFEAVRDANQLLLAQLDDGHSFVYQVEHPGRLIADLSSLIKGVLPKSAVVMIPLGPKMFAVCCMLTALMFPEVSVWRMTQGSSAAPIDRLASDHFSILRLSL